MKNRIVQATLHPIHAVMDRLGRRGTVLAVFSLIYLFIGLKAILDPSTDDGRFMIYAHLPIWARAVLWIVPAALAFGAALQKEKHNDAFGFSALTIPTTVVLVSYAVSWVGFLLGVTTWPNGWVSALQWALILILLLVTSGWTEVKRHKITDTGSVYIPKGGGDR